MTEETYVPTDSKKYKLMIVAQFVGSYYRSIGLDPVEAVKKTQEMYNVSEDDAIVIMYLSIVGREGIDGQAHSIV